MSWGTCYDGTNNIHLEQPPLMNDGRLFVEQQNDQKLMNEHMSMGNEFATNADYRKHLARNATQIMKDNNIHAQTKTGRPLSFPKNHMPNSTPFLYENVQQKSQPYGYEQSDLKNYYLTRHQLQHRLFTPSFDVPDVN
jgi:hypothetical protein